MLLRLFVLAGFLGLPQMLFATTVCTANASNLAFGNIAMGASQNSSATVSIDCNTFGLSLLANARVRLCLKVGAGDSVGSTINARLMGSASLAQLPFQIYRDASRTLILGNTDTEDIDLDLQYGVPVLGGSGSTSTTLYGQVPAQLGLTASSYLQLFSGGHTRLDYRYSEALLGIPSWPSSCTSGGKGGASITFPFTATATVPASCELNTLNNLSFGNVPGLITTHHDQTTHFSYTCTNTTPWAISLDDGLNANGSTRRMRHVSTSQYVEYELYKDSARTQRWGNTLNVDTHNGIGTGSSQNVTVYGRVLANQTAASGNYSDTVTVTITY